MKRVLLFLALMFAPIAAFAQQTSHVAYSFRTAASAPASCNKGDVYFDTTAHAPFYCSDTNTWTAFGGGGGGITGSGTATHIPQFTSSTAVGDTGFTDATINGNEAILGPVVVSGDSWQASFGTAPGTSIAAPAIGVTDLSSNVFCGIENNGPVVGCLTNDGSGGAYAVIAQNDFSIFDGTTEFDLVVSAGQLNLGTTDANIDPNGDVILSTATASTNSPFLQFESQSVGPIEALFELFGDTGGSLNSMACKGAACTPITTGFLVTTTGGVQGSTYATATNCANGAAPAVCGSAASGAVAVPTGTNPTLTVNTSAVSAASRIFLTIDESLTISGVTCNTTLATLLQPVVTARVVNTSFTIQVPATLAVNPACVSYFIEN